MKRITLIAWIIVLISQVGMSTEPQPSLTVVAPSGLTLRKSPAADAPAIKIIPYGEMVHLHEDQPDTSFVSRINWVSGNWIVVNHEGDVGFIFDGYLTTLPLPNYQAEFSPYGTELLYPMETWIQNHYMRMDQPDTITRNGNNKVIHRFENGNQLIQQNKLGYYSSEITLTDTRLMDVYHLLQAMIAEDPIGLASFTGNSVFIEDYKGEIVEIRIQLDDDISIRKVGPDTIQVKIISVDQYCKI